MTSYNAAIYYNYPLYYNGGGEQQADSKGGFDTGHWHEYRRNIEKALEAAKSFDEKKYRKQSKQIADIASQIPLKVEAVNQAKKAENDNIDFSALIRELERMYAIVLHGLEQQKKKLEDEEAIIFLLMIM